MCISMTGFAAKEIDLSLEHGSSIHATFFLKSLNGRYFEAHCKLPQPLQYLEIEILKLLKKELTRGSVYFNLHLSTGNTLQSTIKPAFSIVSQYLQSLKELQETFSIPGVMSITDIARLPHVFESYEPLQNTELKERILEEILVLSQKLNSVRLVEGKNIQEDLTKRIKQIQQYLSFLEPRALEVMEKKKEEVNNLIKEAHTQSSNGEITGLASFYNILDKIDIHEEITRFKSLLQQLDALLDLPEREKGKRIDFTLQELFRETNTIIAKCSDAQISEQAINIKVELEKARELTQNIL